MKEELRARIAELTEDEALRGKKSSAITQKFLSTAEYMSAHNILLYSSMPDEVDTTEILKAAFQSKHVYLPITNTETKEIGLGDAQSFDELTIGSYGILEPISKTSTMPDSLDLVVVPGRAFDEAGHRLGRGGGYYDKFLPKVSCPKIALAFEYQILKEVMAGPRDVPMGQIITEKRVIKCSH